MQIIHTIAEIRQILAAIRRQGKTIGLVPTMGALHEGHYSLIDICRKEADFCVVSIFVNPTQFGPADDLNKYPRTLEADCQGCRQHGADVVFAPSAAEMYPCPETLTWVTVDTLTQHLCGASRPTHFRGVCTVVAKFFNIIQPEVACFGQKDAQQLAVLRRMTRELDFPIRIIGCPIVREPDGLALSSRNRYLTPSQRQQAPCLYQALQQADRMIQGGQRDVKILTEAMCQIISQQPDARIDYISIVDNELLQPVDTITAPVLIALAVVVGTTRLIDNIVVTPC